jgi:hypothetical protein
VGGAIYAAHLILINSEPPYIRQRAGTRPLAVAAEEIVVDCTAGAELLAQLPACDIVHVDKGYDL